MDIQKQGDKLVITVDLENEPFPSESGRTLVLATSNGFVPCAIDGQVVSVSVNCTTPNPNFKRDRKRVGPEAKKQ